MSLINLPDSLSKNSHFSRYYRTWQKNPLSVVFIPLAQICREQGLLEEAKEICVRGLEHHPESVSGRLMLSRVLFDMEEWMPARDIVEKILQDYPAQQEAKTLLEKMNRCQPDFKNNQEHPSFSEDKTEKVFSKSLEPSTNLWENVTMAKIYADQGELKIARQILERLLARNPTHEMALKLKGELS